NPVITISGQEIAVSGASPTGRYAIGAANDVVIGIVRDVDAGMVAFGAGASGICADAIPNDDVVARAIDQCDACATTLRAIDNQALDDIVIADNLQAMMIVDVRGIDFNFVIAGVAINRHSGVIGEVGQVVDDRDGLESAAGDVEINFIVPRRAVCVQDRSTQRAGGCVGIVS